MERKIWYEDYFLTLDEMLSVCDFCYKNNISLIWGSTDGKKEYSFRAYCTNRQADKLLKAYWGKSGDTNKK